MGNNIWSIYNAKYFGHMNIIHAKLIQLAHSLSVCCGFWWSFPFWACFAITVILEWRLHTTISTAVYAKAVCAQKIHPIGNFFTHSLRSKINTPWKVSQFQKVSHFSIPSDFLCRSRNSMIRTAPAWLIDGRNVLGWRKNECLIWNI